MPDVFHQRGHHVQHAHGHRAAFDASADAHSGAMIALMPTAADAKRLALKGGEAAPELHCTLAFLGGDASVWSAADRESVIGYLTDCASVCGPVSSKIFGIAHWNAGGKSPSWVWSVGDDPDADTEDVHLDTMQSIAREAVCGSPNMPDQHSPWVAHICAAYTDDLTLARELEKRNGPVVFDRIRVSFGNDDTDIPLTGGAMTAAARPLRRPPNATEQAAHIDFTGHQESWDQAVGAALRDWSGVTADWRNQISAQVRQDTTAAELSHLSVDSSAAADLLYERMLTTAQAAGRAQQREAEQQGVTVPEWHIGRSQTAALSGTALLRNRARLTADVLSSRLVQSAKQRAMALLGIFDSIRLASEVDETLAQLSDAFDKQWLGAAMTEAQFEGRMAVLEAAAPATYYATEMLDDRTCEPCRQIDGKTFSSLDDAETSYPGGCYVDCQGGGRCRGMVYAVWDQGITAAAEEGGTMTTVTEDLGGRPNQGTKPDKRLRRNKLTGDAPCATCPDDAYHFDTEETPVSPEGFAWDGAASRFTDAQYEKAAAACDPPGKGTVKERCVLPHHDPDGALNRDGLSAAAGRASQLSGHDPATAPKARAHLRAHYHAIGQDVPDNLKAGAHTHDFAGQPPCPSGWMPDPDSDGCVPEGHKPGTPVTCPPWMESDPHGDGCVPVAGPPVTADDEGDSDMTAHLVQAQAAPPVVPDPAGQTHPWSGTIVVEGKPTGDGREFAAGALSWDDPIIPGSVVLRWNRVDSHGGEPRTEAVNVGRIDSIVRDGDQLKATGLFDLSTPDGQTAFSKVKNGFLRGVSIDADDIQQPDVELVYPQNDGPAGDGEPDLLEMLFAQPEKVIYHGGRIRAATLCDIPAFVEAYVTVVDETGSVVAGGAMTQEEFAAAQPVPRSVLAYAAPRAPYFPPSEWFTNPDLRLWTDITVTNEGRIYGHAADRNSCHIGYANQCITMPVEDYHAYYLTGEVECDDGTTVPVGQITVATGHANPSAGAQAAVEHYDHTGYVVADVTTGTDRVGIWVAGAIRSDADPAKVAALRAAGRVSGDWRRIGGKLRLVGLLGVNVGGFAAPSPRARVASGVVQSLVAAGAPAVLPRTATIELSEEEKDQAAMKRYMDILARRAKE